MAIRIHPMFPGFWRPSVPQELTDLFLDPALAFGQSGAQVGEPSQE